MSPRRLVLRTERLTELTSDELASVAAGAPPEPTKDCPDYTYYCLVTGALLCGGTLSQRFC